MDTPEKPECPPGARLIELRRRSGPSLWAIVDEADYEDVSRFRWHYRPPTPRARHCHYAAHHALRADGTQVTELLHRYLLPVAEYVDHINGDGLDNRRANLRATTSAENGRNRRGVALHNTSGFLGVRWENRRQKWRAEVSIPRDPGGPQRRKHAGYFDTREAAAIARDLACLEIDPVHFTLNFPGLRSPLPIVKA